ncbi:MAG TPA: aspartate carbamoyltransferase [Candidatus Limnocylindrales bacterium]|nr:aspartate carbamoyltransferase [Candidatus Limnocylindrales bacterium]
MTNSHKDTINGNFKDKDILSLDQFTPTDLETLFKLTSKMKKIAVKAEPSSILAGKIVVLLFYEPSSRTLASFSAAVKQLGGQTVVIRDPHNFSSVSKGETFEDTVRTFEAYSDAIVLRHPQVGAAQNAADTAAFVPVINAGDGIGEHPTQALLDTYTIYEKFGRLNNLTGILAGDMLNGRTIKSLIRALSLYENNTFYLLSPKELQLSREEFENLKKGGIKLIEIFNEAEMPKNVDYWYWTRVQKERFKSDEEYQKVKNKFVVTTKLVKERAGKDTIIMHPLPRVGEIETTVDSDPRAVYLRSQIRNGMYVRMALLALILGKA